MCGKVRCVGVVKVCGTVLEKGQKGGMCDVSSCTTLTVCHGQATFMFLVRVYLSPANVECDPASQFMCAVQAKSVDIHFCCEANLFPTVQRAQRRKWQHKYYR